jgi:hypothetical protein
VTFFVLFFESVNLANNKGTRLLGWVGLGVDPFSLSTSKMRVQLKDS